MNKDDVAGLVERLLVPDVYGYQGRKQAEEANTLRQEAADALTTLSVRVETLEAGMSQYLKDGQTPLERMEQDQADILGLMKLLQKEKELTEKLRWALSDAVTTNTESCRERDAALHRIEAARLGIIEGLEMAAKALQDDAKLCDCSAWNESECACGAWCEWKTIPSHRAVEIVHALIEESKR